MSVAAALISAGAVIAIVYPRNPLNSARYFEGSDNGVSEKRRTEIPSRCTSKRGLHELGRMPDESSSDWYKGRDLGGHECYSPGYETHDEIS